ncbi:MAG: PPK2 family polyphosphate kinase [Saprospiraceae bacterium]
MIRLADISTDAPAHLTKETAQAQTAAWVRRIGELQAILYAQKKYSLLVVLQGMDASGKDGAVKNVFNDCNPVGLNIISFKKPTEEEFAHDFLWRIHRHAPAKGMMHIFIRSHYEDILIQRVHKWIDEKRVDKRIQAINAFEELLHFDNNTIILKFYLHISKEQQEKELHQRLTEPDKHWKHNPGDWKERELWDEYRRCYEDAINRSTIPWTVVPVDQRWYRDYIMSQTIVTALEKLDLQYPALKNE